eukprot:CAMPEP_0185257482 /NCGR_PEP_ID=MMETSP1359-20130426/6543_1 /TAXON_ID=552665 /ORGANISM="Bigelowiella longifila, Strain CCMP242" /LENGTH=232 /DNA_ID=CAMNT_0027842601 /DNA_START=1169 /DNA_END=1867 /DNA_ORIENTATION=+
MGTILCSLTLFDPLQTFIDGCAGANEHKDKIRQNDKSEGSIFLPKVQWQAFSIHIEDKPESSKVGVHDAVSSRRISYCKLIDAVKAAPKAQFVMESLDKLRNHEENCKNDINQVKHLKHVWEVYEVILGNGDRDAMEEEMRKQTWTVLREFVNCFSSNSQMNSQCESSKESTCVSGNPNIECYGEGKLVKRWIESCNDDDQEIEESAPCPRADDLHLGGSMINADDHQHFTW